MIFGQIFIITLFCNILAAESYVNKYNVNWNCLSSRINVFVRTYHNNISRISALQTVPYRKKKPPSMLSECEFIKNIDGWSNFTIDLNHFSQHCDVNFDKDRQNIWIDFVERSHPLLDFYQDFKFQVNCSTSQLEKFMSSFKELNSAEQNLPEFSLELLETAIDSTIIFNSVQDNFVYYGKSYNLAAKLNNFENDFQILSCNVKSLASGTSNESQVIELIDSQGCSTDLTLNGNFVYTMSPDSKKSVALLSIPSMFQFYDSKILMFECVAKLFVKPIDCLNRIENNRFKHNAINVNSKKSIKNVLPSTVNPVNDFNEVLLGSGIEADEVVNTDDSSLSSEIFFSSNFLFPIASTLENKTSKTLSDFVEQINTTNKVFHNDSTPMSLTTIAAKLSQNIEIKNDMSLVKLQKKTSTKKNPKHLEPTTQTPAITHFKNNDNDLITKVLFKKLRPSILTAKVIVYVVPAIKNRVTSNSTFINQTTFNFDMENLTAVKTLPKNKTNVSQLELEKLYKVCLALAILFVLSCLTNALTCCCFLRNSNKKSQIKKRIALSNSSQQFFYNSTGTLQSGTLQKKTKNNNANKNNDGSFWIPYAGLQKMSNGIFSTSNANNQTDNLELDPARNVMTNSANCRNSINSYASVKHRKAGNRIIDPLVYEVNESGVNNALYRPSPTNLSTSSTKNGFWRQTYNDLDSEDSRRHYKMTSKTFGSGFGDEVTMNTSVITSTRSTNSSGNESITSSSMLVDDTASTLPSSPQPDLFENEFGQDLPPPPPYHNERPVYNMNSSQILPLQFSTLKRNVVASFPNSANMSKPNCHMNGLDGNIPQKVAPLPLLSTFSSFQQCEPANEMNYKNNQDSMIYDQNLLENETKQNIKHVYTIL